jgi:hypothetical protein
LEQDYFYVRMGSGKCRTLMSVFWALLCVWLLTGCASTRIDWSSRIGTYTFDQAVLEFGPPDKYAKVNDGTSVAEWLTRRGHAYSYSPYVYGYGYGFYPYPYGPYLYPYTQTIYSSDVFLRLIFTPDGYLRSWKQFYR